MDRKFMGSNIDMNNQMNPHMDFYQQGMGMHMGMHNMNMMNMMNNNQQQQFNPAIIENAPIKEKKEFYGEKLYHKISQINEFANFSELFPKIVGIFIDLDESIIVKLINDNRYFELQVRETLKLLAERNNN